MAAVGIRLGDRVYELTPEHAQFLAGQLQRRLVVPGPVGDLADQLWAQSMLNPSAGEVGRDIVPTEEQKRAALETMTTLRPEGDAAAWDELAAALRRELPTE
jgi:hypothetical protein